MYTNLSLVMKAYLHIFVFTIYMVYVPARLWWYTTYLCEIFHYYYY